MTNKRDRALVMEIKRLGVYMICLLLLIVSILGCNNRSNASKGEEQQSKAPVSEDLSKLKFEARTITYSLGLWAITNPTDDEIRVNLKELVSHYSYDLMTLDGEVISTMPMSKCIIKEQEFIGVGPRTSIRMAFNIPYSYEIVEKGGEDFYVVVRNHNKLIPSVYYRSKNGSVYHYTMSKEEALQRVEKMNK